MRSTCPSPFFRSSSVRMMPTWICILSFRSSWSRNGFGPLGARSEGRQHLALGVLDLALVDRRRLPVLGVLGCVEPGDAPENEQVRERVAAEPVGAVHSRGNAHSPARRGPRCADCCVSGSTRMPPHRVVGRLGPTSIGSLVMSTSPSSLNWWYIAGSLRLMSSAVRREWMSRNTPPVGAPPPGLHFAVDQRGRRCRALARGPACAAPWT